MRTPSVFVISFACLTTSACSLDERGDDEPLEQQTATLEQSDGDTCPIPAPFTPPTALPGFAYHHDVLIGKGGTCDLTIDIVSPSPPSPTPRPALVYVHGGGWRSGDKNGQANTIRNAATRGYTTASINYRFTPGSHFPAQLEDVKLAIRFLRANAATYSIDPARIGVWGTSAGGHLAALLGTADGLFEGSGGSAGFSSSVQCVVDFYGPTDFTTPFASSWSSAMSLLNGQDPTVAMPGSYANVGDPPVLILHGDADPTVPCTDSATFARQLREKNIPVTFGLVNGAGHGLSSVPWTKDLAHSFLAFHLLGTGSAPPRTPAESVTPVAWWKLDDDVTHPADSSGESRGVTLQRRNASSQSHVPGHSSGAGGAIFFDGGYSYLSNRDANTNAAVRGLNFSTGMTAELWVKLEKLPSETVPLPSSAKLLYRVNSTTKNGYELYLSTADNKPHFKVWLNGVSTDVAAGAIAKGRWVHLVGTHRPSPTTAAGVELKLFVDGELSGSKDTTTGGLGDIGDSDLKLGGTTTSTDNPPSGIIGSLDEVRLYDRVLSAEEVLGRFHADDAT